ncbi:MAG: amidohydrolase family protein [Desulfurococcales archaeon]|nr:amidohydrolase family protein [Desulfurococcales archaeon]
MGGSEAFAVKAGLALVGEDLEARRGACVWVRGGIVESIETSASCPPGAVGGDWLVLLPQPANAHVHSGDHAFPEYGANLGLLDAVAPPGGLKHRLLASTPRRALVDALREYYTLAWRYGTGLLADFREGGGEGCVMAREALRSVPPGMDVFLLGRPGPGWPVGCDGLGLSSPLDYPPGEVKRLVEAHRPAVTHVAEHREAREAGDLEAALEAGFDAIVHGVYLSGGDLEELASRGVALILCVRSNAWHSLGLPPVAGAWRAGVTLGLGTDNAGWFPPDPWREAEALALAARLQGLRAEAARLALEALFSGGYRALGAEPRLVVEGRPAGMVGVADRGLGIRRARDPLWAVVKRVTGEAVELRVDGGSVWGVGATPYRAPRL